jgi:hypothetical protein
VTSGATAGAILAIPAMPALLAVVCLVTGGYALPATPGGGIAVIVTPCVVVLRAFVRALPAERSPAGSRTPALQVRCAGFLGVRHAWPVPSRHLPSSPQER